MSNLKHLTLEQLEQERRVCNREIGRLNGKINNQNTRLSWINKYIKDKSVFIGNFNGQDVYSTEDVKSVIDYLQSQIEALKNKAPTGVFRVSGG